MILATICVHGVRALTVSVKPIPRGIIGAKVQFEYADPMWDGLSKTVVFRAGYVTKDVLNAGEVVDIPPEVVAEVGEILKVGVYGEGVPTLWADLGRIHDATDPSGDETTDPTLPVWAQLQEQIDELRENGSPSGGGGKPGENGGYYTPSVNQPDNDTLQFDFTPSKADMPAIEPVQVDLPAGPKGDDYTLSEADKKKIAEMAAVLVEVPDSGGNVDYGAENAGKLLYVGADGFATVLALGAGLAVVDGVLTITSQVVTSAICGQAVCGNAICGGA